MPPPCYGQLLSPDWFIGTGLNSLGSRYIGVRRWKGHSYIASFAGLDMWRGGFSTEELHVALVIKPLPSL